MRWPFKRIILWISLGSPETRQNMIYKSNEDIIYLVVLSGLPYFLSQANWTFFPCRPQIIWRDSCKTYNLNEWRESPDATEWSQITCSYSFSITAFNVPNVNTIRNRNYEYLTAVEFKKLELFCELVQAGLCIEEHYRDGQYRHACVALGKAGCSLWRL